MSTTPTAIQAQQMGAMSDSDYTAKVMTAAPAPVVEGATIVEAQKDGSMRTIQKGTNGFTCMLLDLPRPCARTKMAWPGWLL